VSEEYRCLVIPAQAGIQFMCGPAELDSRLRGNDGAAANGAAANGGAESGAVVSSAARQ